ncbi:MULTISPECIES: PhzF family phenazine biosynthesis protein [Yersiniaceae]|uniref:PhzF family phenazine biosynthesis protein n=1 Tax=Nissabacter archeti TaxID=1917880 RepID=A0ABS5JFD4_9GAMM|nr:MULTISPECIES: PhzF family phenazine biosynthesis protein [Yersiniaceae]MBS0968569.1 PhzF family phenazine biosynthesis protein [Nissabacter archeti]MDV5139809.1 PhzF family phenazine biosynthesis protein [Chimaeribacter arupi]
MKNNHQAQSMRVPFFQVDAFSRHPFSGNPAAVCMLEKWLDDTTLQRIAQENNLSETAFVVKTGDSYGLRWFTPAVEVDLCGHATLAAACVLFTRYVPHAEEIRFHTRSGELTVRGSDEGYILNFPLVHPVRIDTPPGLLAALGLGSGPAEIWQASDIVVIINDENVLDSLSPDFSALAQFDTRGVVVCTPAKAFDFRSRWFGPQVGVNEDPVTGSAHTFLAPLWGEKLGKKVLSAQQGGKRKGEITCRIKENNRVELCGEACIVIEGELFVSLPHGDNASR